MKSKNSKVMKVVWVSKSMINKLYLLTHQIKKNLRVIVSEDFKSAIYSLYGYTGNTKGLILKKGARYLLKYNKDFSPIAKGVNSGQDIVGIELEMDDESFKNCMNFFEDDKPAGGFVTYEDATLFKKF